MSRSFRSGIFFARESALVFLLDQFERHVALSMPNSVVDELFASVVIAHVLVVRNRCARKQEFIQVVGRTSAFVKYFRSAFAVAKAKAAKRKRKVAIEK